MGHDIDTHTKSYHRWLTEADVAAFVASRKKLDKKNPPKAGSLGFSLGVLPSFHSVKKPSSQLNSASEIPLNKPRRISWLTDLQGPRNHGNGQLLTRFGSSHPLKKA